MSWILAVVLLHGLSSGLSKAVDDGASAYLPPSAASTKVALLEQAAPPHRGLTAVLAPIDGSWKVVHAHMSEPVKHEL
jgi:hypothetical protein